MEPHKYYFGNLEEEQIEVAKPFRLLKTEEAKYYTVLNKDKPSKYNSLAEWVNSSNRLAENIKKAEKQILDTRANRVNNICFAMLILLYAIGVGIALKYLV